LAGRRRKAQDAGAMPSDRYYRSDLAWVHHAGYSHHVEQVVPGILRLLREGGVPARARVLDVGCGSGRLARELLAAGYAVHGIDASPAMIALAREQAPGARFDVLGLPTGVAAGAPGGLPLADAVVSTGHVLNYLDTRDDIARALGELACAVRPGGVLAIDLMTERFAEARDPGAVHAKVEDEWAIVTRFSRPQARRFDRRITVFRRVDGRWRRSDERHRNVTCDAADAVAVLRENGIEARLRAAFGEEALPEGLVVLAGVRVRPGRPPSGTRGTAAPT
jgi:SAM-dependent methyltransferase